MNAILEVSQSEARYELRYQSLALPGYALAFPCDAEGHVNLDQLSERAKSNYFYARAVVGRDLATPAVQLILRY